MKTNQFNGFKQLRPNPQLGLPKPSSAFVQRSPPTPTDQYAKQSKDTNLRLPIRQSEQNRAKLIKEAPMYTRTPGATAYGQPKVQDANRQPTNYFAAKRPNSITNNNEEEAYKMRGIALTAKITRPASGNKPREHQIRTSTRGADYVMPSPQQQLYNKPALGTSSSHGRLLDKFRSGSGNSNTPTNYDRRAARDQYSYNKEISEYQKLHQKLNSLQNKIADMKTNLERKRVEKQTILEKEQRDRKIREAERNSRDKNPAPTSDSPKYKKNAPPALNTVGKPPNKQQKKHTQQIPKPQTCLKGIVTQVPKQNKQLHSLNFNPYSPRHNLYYVSEITRTYKQDKSLAREHLINSMHILRMMQSIKRPSNQQIGERAVKLPQKQIYKDKKTIVFDLDQTLIHCNDNPNVQSDVKLPITFPTGQVVQAGINIRPYTFQLLKALSKNFEIIVFTASHSCYANVVLDHLDPNNEYIQHRLYREHCYPTPQGMYVKDLRVIDRNLTNMVLIDNAAYSYAFQLQNGIPIVPYYQGRNDFQLKALQTYLEGMIWLKDMRESNIKTFKLHEYKNYEEPEQLVQELYGQWIV